MSELVAAGLNHKTAPVELRERLAASTDEVVRALPLLKERAGFGETDLLGKAGITLRRLRLTPQRLRSQVHIS